MPDQQRQVIAGNSLINSGVVKPEGIAQPNLRIQGHRNAARGFNHVGWKTVFAFSTNARLVDIRGARCPPYRLMWLAKQVASL
jgi:hypothetical protein